MEKKIRATLAAAVALLAILSGTAPVPAAANGGGTYFYAFEAGLKPWQPFTDNRDLSPDLAWGTGEDACLDHGSHFAILRGNSLLDRAGSAGIDVPLPTGTWMAAKFLSETGIMDVTVSLSARVMDPELGGSSNLRWYAGPELPTHLGQFEIKPGMYPEVEWKRFDYATKVLVNDTGTLGEEPKVFVALGSSDEAGSVAIDCVAVNITPGSLER